MEYRMSFKIPKAIVFSLENYGHDENKLWEDLTATEQELIKNKIQESVLAEVNYTTRVFEGAKSKDFEVYYKVCTKCGYDTAKSSEASKPNCWRCGNAISRDYSERALKKDFIIKHKNK
jgi:predicted RNA-binding Zn-ribbon protein involved in translation (DUF1610 family)